MPDLFSYWQQICFFHNRDEELISDLWKEIETAYRDGARYYHTLSHLEYMLEKLWKHEKELQQADIVGFSVFYHDIIYKAGSKDNEIQSAALAADRLLKLGLKTSEVNRCRELILATAHHQKSVDLDTKYLLDFDLAILGETAENYWEYSRNIRKEYRSYPGFIYRKGRKKVLQNFLSMPQIFKTESFLEQYEEQARRNLKDELLSLS